MSTGRNVADERARRRSATVVLAAAGVAALIEQGSLAAGQCLPTVRQLAGDLGIAAGTVMRAYKELESAGSVRGDRGAARRHSRERDPVDVDAALRTLAYCHRAEDVGAP